MGTSVRSFQYEMYKKTAFRRKLDISTLIALAIALRAAVSLYSYSGRNDPPMYGDYEAQRHWQEITINLEPNKWYTNSSSNNLLYWGLDYPPLTAFHSFVVGQVARFVNKEFVALNESRGFESKLHKTFMRSTVLVADILIYIPAVTLLGLALENTFYKQMFVVYIAIALIYPGQILIDNGHFQYNCISLGFSALAIAGLISNRVYFAAFMFCLALNYKQMELYHALPIFVFILRQFVFENKRIQLRRFFGIASIVILTFAALWYPWLEDLETAKNVVIRLFPVSRGVFEDKVASFWCALNVLYKLKNHFSNAQMALICLIATSAMVVPINVALFFKCRKQNFLFALVNTALLFFLFSFQVHEKSILLATLPCSCLLYLKPLLTFHLMQSSVLSMMPLLIKDDLMIPFYTLSIIFSVVSIICQKEILEDKKAIIFLNVSTILYFFVAVFICNVSSPPNYPFLWPLFVAVFCFSQFVLCLFLGIFFQFK